MIAAPARETWLDANQRYLTAALVRVRAALEAHAAGAAGPADAAAAEAALTAAAARLPGPAALDVVCAAFGLSPFERDVLLLCAGMELEFARRGRLRHRPR